MMEEILDDVAALRIISDDVVGLLQSWFALFRLLDEKNILEPCLLTCIRQQALLTANITTVYRRCVDRTKTEKEESEDSRSRKT